MTIARVVLASLAALAPAQTVSAQSDDLSWMTGCWVREDHRFKETWSPDEGGALFGYSAAKTSGRLVYFEHLRIDQTSDGPVLSVYPNGGEPKRYEPAEAGEASVAFTLLQDYFPQRIAYRRTAEGLLLEQSRIDGSRLRTVEFIACGAGD